MTKKSNGFTLVEIIVALAIFAIIIGSSASLILSGSDVFRKNADMIHASRISQYTIDWLENELTFATTISVTSNVPQGIDSGVKAIRIGSNGTGEGHLLRHTGSQWEEVFTWGFYENFKVLLDVEPNSYDRLSLNVEVQNGNNEVIHRVNKIMDFPNEIDLNVQGDSVASYPVILYSNDVEIVITNPEGFKNSPTQFAIGGNPKYVVSAWNGINNYILENKKPGDPGAIIPDNSIHFELEDYEVRPGEILEGGYYLTRNTQYLKNPPPMTKEQIYDYLIGGNPPYGVKINLSVDPDFLPEPSSNTQPGDLRKIGSGKNIKLYVFFPRQPRWEKDYAAAAPSDMWWLVPHYSLEP